MATNCSNESCRLCGEATESVANPRVRERWKHEVCDAAIESLCSNHLYEMRRWLDGHAGRNFGDPVSVDDMNSWLCMVISKLADRQKRLGRVARCERVTASDERCYRFASSVWDGHFVCGICHGTLRHAVERGIRVQFESANVKTVSHVQAAVDLLLAQRPSL
jgi:hypothetical protein